jgi:hypothetical protein
MSTGLRAPRLWDKTGLKLCGQDSGYRHSLLSAVRSSASIRSNQVTFTVALSQGRW